jgi:hypothetical protein
METQERSIIEKKPPTEKRYYTPEEYLALEEAAIDKSEYHDGVNNEPYCFFCTPSSLCAFVCAFVVNYSIIHPSGF